MKSAADPAPVLPSTALAPAHGVGCHDDSHFEGEHFRAAARRFLNKEHKELGDISLKTYLADQSSMVFYILSQSPDSPRLLSFNSLYRTDGGDIFEKYDCSTTEELKPIFVPVTKVKSLNFFLRVRADLVRKTIALGPEGNDVCMNQLEAPVAVERIASPDNPIFLQTIVLPNALDLGTKTYSPDDRQIRPCLPSKSKSMDHLYKMYPIDTTLVDSSYEENQE